MAKPVFAKFLAVGVNLGDVTVGQATACLPMVRHLLDRLDTYQIPATWYLPQLDRDFTTLIRERQGLHEIAYAWPRQLVHGQVSQTLRSMLQAAASLNLDLRGLAVHAGSTAPWELLARTGFRMVCALGQSGPVQPQALRYGLWSLPVSCVLPKATRFWELSSVHQILAGLRSAAAKQQAYHLVFDAAALATSGSSGRSVVDRVVDALAKQQHEQVWEMGRLRDAEYRLKATLCGQPTRSILRRAA